ncbi:GNAT family N-acetyltransferase [Nocardioides sp. URHA0020]|uniref:GNAT family N-acetyltransferase n=1 Tax=Nocardioides sp. URHA0020 TaxID=1380392 RepID=UPI0004911AB5|nr:GNAT family N-acetyltransferase [Nocardioides sp. URHA0020]
MADVETSHNPAEHRYEAHLDGELAGFAEYQLTDALVIFTHTQVDPTFEGKGIGSTLARFALDDVRATGTHQVLPLCPFIKSWIDKHPEYAELVHGVPQSTVTD